MHLWRHNYAKQILGQIGPYSHPINFRTNNVKELKFYAVIDNYKLFSNIEKLGEKVLIMQLWRHNYAKFNSFQSKLGQIDI